MPNHFFSQNGLTACCTDTSITLFWESPPLPVRSKPIPSCWTMPLLLIPKRPTVHWRICVRKRPIRCSFSGGAAALGN